MGVPTPHNMVDAKLPRGIDSVLRVSGTQIVSGNGQEVILKGVSETPNIADKHASNNSCRLDWEGT